MRDRFRGGTIATAAMWALFSLVAISSAARGQAPASVSRTADGKPDLSGIWQAVNTAAWDIQDHQAQKGVPAGIGVVEGNEIPYQPWAAAKKKENYEKRMTADPETKCYLPGVPRITYMPYPFQIVQSPTTVLIAYEYDNASRIVYMNSKEEAAADSWMGWSRGRWEGETLVVDVTGFNDRTWFDRAGNYHSDALHVIERYTPIDADHLMYEATIEDPKVFTRPWKMSMPLYRRVEKNAQLGEYLCVEFAEELMYGSLSKKTSR